MLALAAASCAAEPAFVAGDAASDTGDATTDAADVPTVSDATDVADSADAPDAPDTADVPDVIVDPCSLCVAGEQCVDGQCRSCAQSCGQMLAEGECGNDGCGGACGCSTAGACDAKTCTCQDEACTAIAGNTGAAGVTLTFDVRDRPVIGLVAGDGGAFDRTYDLRRWDGTDFASETVDALAPTVIGSSSLVVLPDESIHAVHSGSASSPRVPRYMWRAPHGTWTFESPSNGANCLAPRVVVRPGGPALVCFQQGNGSVIVYERNNASGDWSVATESPPLGATIDADRWPREWSVAYKRGTDSWFVAFVEREAGTAKAHVKLITAAGGRDWSEVAEVGALHSADVAFVNDVVVVRDDDDQGFIVVRDRSETAPNRPVLRYFYKPTTTWTSTVAYEQPNENFDMAFAVAPQHKGADVIVAFGASVVYRTHGSVSTPTFSDGPVLEVDSNVISALATASDALGVAHVAITTDGTVVRYWSPYPPPAP